MPFPLLFCIGFLGRQRCTEQYRDRHRHPSAYVSFVLTGLGILGGITQAACEWSIAFPMRISLKSYANCFAQSRHTTYGSPYGAPPLPTGVKGRVRCRWAQRNSMFRTVSITISSTFDEDAPLYLVSPPRPHFPADRTSERFF